MLNKMIPLYIFFVLLLIVILSHERAHREERQQRAAAHGGGCSERRERAAGASGRSERYIAARRAEHCLSMQLVTLSDTVVMHSRRN